MLPEHSPEHSPERSAVERSAAERSAVEQAKARSTAQIMMRCARLIDEVALGRLRAQTGHPWRPAHTGLFPHIELDGSRITDIARRAGVSKQAVAPLVAELVEWGVLERVPDPSDGRARLVRFTIDADGTHAIVQGLAVLGALEAELADGIGAPMWTALHAALTALLPRLTEMRRGVE